MFVHVPTGGKPVKSWASQIEDGAMEQADNLSRLPFVISHVALMPDAHQGYGMPIGGVLFADKAVVPYAIGVDIGCGVVLAETDLTVADLEPNKEKVLNQILRDVPVGNGPHGNRKEPMAGEALLDLMEYADVPHMVHTDWWMGACRQVGSLGGGNHFIELQADDEDRVYVMLHSGSRSLGKKTCDHFAKLALEQNRLWYSELPDKELAYVPVGTAGFDDYWVAMEFAMRFAEVNRARMLADATAALNRHAGTVGVNVIVDCHHNYAAWENHKGRNGIVHRKGAVRARPGEDVLIPGSMGTPSFWAKGLGNPDSFDTCQHGAGRAMSRAAARKMYSGVEEMRAELDAAGTKVYTANDTEVIDEAPRAYKEIEQVMADSLDLVTVEKRLMPLGTVKG